MKMLKNRELRQIAYQNQVEAKSTATICAWCRRLPGDNPQKAHGKTFCSDGCHSIYALLRVPKDEIGDCRCQKRYAAD